MTRAGGPRLAVLLGSASAAVFCGKRLFCPSVSPSIDRTMEVQTVQSKFVVIGGGIAGVCCAEELCQLCPEDMVTLITASDVVKAVSNWKQVGKVMETFDVQERCIHGWKQKASNLNVVKATVSFMNATG